MKFTISAARPQDVFALSQLIRALAEYEGLAEQLSFTETALAEELFRSDPIVEAVVAWKHEADGVASNAIGFALFFQNFSTFLGRRGLYLEDLFVVQSCRGHGVGKALLRHGAELAVSRGYGRYEWSVLDWNASAISFYRAFGAEVMPDWRICRLSGEALRRVGSPRS